MKRSCIVEARGCYFCCFGEIHSWFNQQPLLTSARLRCSPLSAKSSTPMRGTDFSINTCRAPVLWRVEAFVYWSIGLEKCKRHGRRDRRDQDTNLHSPLPARLACDSCSIFYLEHEFQVGLINGQLEFKAACVLESLGCSHT